MSKREQRIARTDWMYDNGQVSKKRGKKLAHKRIRQHDKEFILTPDVIEEETKQMRDGGKKLMEISNWFKNKK